MNPNKSSVTNVAVAGKNGKRSWRALLWTNGIILLVVVLIAVFNFRPIPNNGTALVAPGPETTYATGPLKANGDVDFAAYLNEQFVVPPEQNAMMDLIRIVGPNIESTNLPPEFFERLAMDAPPNTGNYFQDLESWIESESNEEFECTVNDVLLDRWQIQRIASSTPYSKGQLPIVDQWFDVNESHLKAIRKAVRKPAYYMPYVGDSLLDSFASFSVEMRNLARSLNTSAMGRLGNGDIDGAIDDQIAILRLGRHVGRRGSMVELLVGLAIDGIGQKSLQQTIYCGKCTDEQLKRLARELDAIPSPPRLGRPHLIFERLVGLEFTINAGRNGPFPWDGNWSSFMMGKEQQSQGLFDSIVRSSIDWSVVCEQLNEYYDEIESILGTNDFAKQAQKIRDLEFAFEENIEEQDGTVKLAVFLLGGRTGRGKLAAGYLGNLLLPAVSQIIEAGGRNAAYEANTRIAIALERYRLKNIATPQSLQQLVPEFLSKVPLDPFSGTLPIYDPQQGDPYLLYSVGHNGVDDGGASMKNAAYDESDVTAVPEMRSFDQWIQAFAKENREREIAEDWDWEQELPPEEEPSMENDDDPEVKSEPTAEHDSVDRSPVP